MCDSVPVWMCVYLCDFRHTSFDLFDDDDTVDSDPLDPVRAAYAKSQTASLLPGCGCIIIKSLIIIFSFCFVSFFLALPPVAIRFTM